MTPEKCNQNRRTGSFGNFNCFDNFMLLFCNTLNSSVYTFRMRLVYSYVFEEIRMKTE